MDIPVLGQAASNNVKENTVSELVIFIRATLVNDHATVSDEDIRLYKTFTPDTTRRSGVTKVTFSLVVPYFRRRAYALKVMIATIHWVFLTAVRGFRLFGGLFIMLVLSTAISTPVLGSSAMIEQAQMATVFAAGSGRLILVLGFTIFIAFHVQRMFETREVEAVLCRAQFPLPIRLGVLVGLRVSCAVGVGAILRRHCYLTVFHAGSHCGRRR